METKYSAHCLEVQENLSAYVDGEVTKSERALVETHLTECGDCRDKLSETMRLIAAVASLPRLEAGPAYLGRLRERMTEPESIGDRIQSLLGSRSATAGFAFALGAAACFLVMAPGERGPAAKPADGSVEVALTHTMPAASAPAATAPAATSPAATSPEAPGSIAPVPADLLAKASTAPAGELAGRVVTPSALPAGAPVVGGSTMAAVQLPPVTSNAVLSHADGGAAQLLASVPRPKTGGDLAALPAVRAPHILPPNVAPRTVPSDADVESMKLEGAGELASLSTASGSTTRGMQVAAAPGLELGRGADVRTGSGAMTGQRAAVGAADKGEEPAETAPAPEPAVRRDELLSVLSGTRLVEGDEAERASASPDAGQQLQVMAVRAPQFLRELASTVAHVPGVKMTRVLALGQPALQVELSFDGAHPADSVAQLKEELNHLASVKAVAAVTTDKNPRRGTLLIPLSAPLAR